MSEQDASPATGTEPLLEAAGLTVAYGRGTPVLHDADLRIVPGARMCLVGSNGCGKTTLLRALAGAIKPNAGSVQWGQEPLRYSRSALNEHRQRVQLVLQNSNDQLLAATAEQDAAYGPFNLGLSEEESRERAVVALTDVGAGHLADEPLQHLSVGQRKRVAIAGAMAMHPQVLLMDEPTAGLDPHGVEKLTDTLDALAERGTAIVMATHDVDFAWQWADEVAVIHRGRITQNASAKILSDTELLDAIHLRPPMIVSTLHALGINMPNPAPRTPAELATYLDTGRATSLRSY